MQRSTELSEKTCADQQSDTPVKVKEVKMSSTESDVMMTEICEKTGFSYAGEEDLLKCLRCEAEIKGYSYVKDNPESLCAIHLWLSPSCPKLKDIPEAENILSRHNERICRRLQQRNIDADPCLQRIVSETGDKLKSMHFYPPPCKKQYEELNARRQTFRELKNCPISNDDIAEAGFFHHPEAGKHDKVTCFWCHGSLKNWRSGDCPWAEHSKYYPGCGFLKQKKGTAYIMEIRAKMTDREKTSSRSLTYVFDPDFYSYGRLSYNDVYSRLRSLRIGELPNAAEKAHRFAKQGFFWTDLDGEVIRCYYCGIRMPKELDIDRVVEEHRNLSKECAAAKGQIETLSTARTDKASHWQILPCLCVISNAEYAGGSYSLCPDCGDTISFEIPIFQSMTTSIMEPREHNT